MAVMESANLDAAEKKVKIIKSAVDLVLDRLMVLVTGNDIVAAKRKKAIRICALSLFFLFYVTSTIFKNM